MRPSLLVTILALLANGCGMTTGVGGGQSSVCAEAAAHVADCEGGAVVDVGGCDNAQAAAAETVVASSCEQLASGVGKGDGPGDLLCIALVIPLFVTHLQPGVPCCYGYQCEGGDMTCISHRCMPRRPVGSACGDDNTCEAGLVCLPVGKCGAALPEGGTCKKRSDCVEGLACGVAHLCALAAPDGASCTSDDQCQGTCIAGTCAARSAAGGACDDSLDCTTGLACPSKTCIEIAAGSACKADRDCLGEGLVCQFGVCSVAPKTGERCDPKSTFACEDFDDSCFQNVCQPKHDTGGPCAVLFDCKHGLCTNHVCR